MNFTIEMFSSKLRIYELPYSLFIAPRFFGSEKHHMTTAEKEKSYGFHTILPF